MLVREIMTPYVELVDPNATMRDAARRMRQENVGALPVGERGRLIGMITDRDIVLRGVAAERGPSTTAVRDLMSEGLFFCYADDDVEDAARMMADHQVRRLPVLESDNRLVGMIALADISRASARASVIALQGVSQPTADERRPL